MEKLSSGRQADRQTGWGGAAAAAAAAATAGVEGHTGTIDLLASDAQLSAAPDPKQSHLEAETGPRGDIAIENTGPRASSVGADSVRKLRAEDYSVESRVPLGAHCDWSLSWSMKMM